MTLYEKYGGFAKIHRIVLDFYESLLDSDNLGPFFENVDMRGLIDHQTEFIAGAMGGPVTTTDARLRAAHQALPITNAHFDELIHILRETLEDAEVEDDDISTLIKAVEQKRAVILS